MQNTLGAISYLSAVVSFTVLIVFLLTRWRGHLQGISLVLALSTTIIWALLAAYIGYIGKAGQFLYPLYNMVEIFRDMAWFAFLLKLLEPVLHAEGEKRLKVRFAVPLLYSASLFFIILSFAHAYFLSAIIKFDLNILSHITLSIIGLILIEQLFRNTRTEERWPIKFLCFGIGSIFAYDFFIYSNALLVKSIDTDLWSARGFINALVVPLIAISAAKNSKWSPNVFVSRRIMLHTTAILGAGLYLMIMALGGFYIREFSGTWGGVAQIIFFFGAIVLLLLLMFSGSIRAWLKVFLNKHFYNYKYDYRDEWMRFTKTLAKASPEGHFRERAIKAIAEIIDSTGGVLWLKDDFGNFSMVTHWNMPLKIEEVEAPDSSLVRFLEKSQWIIDLDEYCNDQEFYEDLQLPAWLSECEDAWLIVPLMQLDRLKGFILLARPRLAKTFNWEDSDLLKAASRQAASYLILLDTTEKLVDASQFEAFNRLSAYIVHDIKNVVAQLDLVVNNAKKHIDNPEFMKDAIYTVQNSVGRMNRLLGHLRKEDNFSIQPTAKAVDLVNVVSEVVDNASVNDPKPTVEFEKHGINVIADRDRFAAIIGHLVQNAQEATENDGWVKLRVMQKNNNAIIEIEDNGCGMDEDFIKDRLFKPFDTTKGNAGMGIGVYESKVFIASLGGEIRVKSELGKGTLFQLIMPMLNRTAMGNNIAGASN